MRTTTKTTAFRTMMAAFAVPAGALAAVLVGGCSVGPGAPEQPTYEASVGAILDAHCVRCHGSPPLGDPNSDLLPAGSPAAMAFGQDYLRMPPHANFRLDRYEDTDCGSPTTCVLGAKTMAPSIKMYISDASVLPMPPPPSAPLSGYEFDTLTRWADEKPMPLER